MSSPTFVDTLLTAPAREPITVAEVKAAVRFKSSSEDALFDAYIPAARAVFEELTGRQLILARWESRVVNVGSNRVLELPHAPLLDVDEILDADGAAIAADSYTVRPSGTAGGSPREFAAVDPHCRRGRVELGEGLSWPTGVFTVRYWAGYGNGPEEIPGLVKTALFLLVGHFHKHRSEVHELERAASLVRLPFGVDQIIKGFKYSALPVGA